jgi:nitroreductase
MISQIVSYIAEDKNILVEDALKSFFDTNISKKIEDVETGYYLESPSYVYEILKKEEGFMSVNEIIKKRKSIRKYEKGAVVTEEQIKTILEAGMLAPSACNSRPFQFIVVRNREKLEEIMKIHPYTQMLETASLAIIVCADLNLQNEISEGYFPEDCGAVTENMLLQATELELGTCWCGVYPKEDKVANFRKLFNLPENIVPFNVIAVGKPAEEFGSRGFYEEEKVTWID